MPFWSVGVFSDQAVFSCRPSLMIASSKRTRRVPRSVIVRANKLLSTLESVTIATFLDSFLSITTLWLLVKKCPSCPNRVEDNQSELPQNVRMSKNKKLIFKRALIVAIFRFCSWSIFWLVIRSVTVDADHVP